MIVAAFGGLDTPECPAPATPTPPRKVRGPPSPPSASCLGGYVGGAVARFAGSFSFILLTRLRRYSAALRSAEGERERRGETFKGGALAPLMRSFSRYHRQLFPPRCAAPVHSRVRLPLAQLFRVRCALMSVARLRRAAFCIGQARPAPQKRFAPHHPLTPWRGFAAPRRAFCAPTVYTRCTIIYLA